MPSLDSKLHMFLRMYNPNPIYVPALQGHFSALPHLHEHFLHGGHWHSKTRDAKLFLAGWREEQMQEE